jgi:hypothetical protein
MNLRGFSLRLFLFAAAVSACEGSVFAQAFDGGTPTFSPPSVTGPSLTGPPSGSPTGGSQTFVSPTSAPPPLESEPPFSAPAPMEPGVSGAPGVPPGPPSAGPPYGPPPGGPPYGPPPGGPPYGPPPYYPEPRSYVPPVYVPPSGPLVIPEVSPLETRFWLRSEYIAWWTKDAPLPTPLVTTGSPSDTVPAALGQPNTQVLYGGENVDMGVASGWRLDLGMWLDRDQRFGLQAGFFILERQESGFGAFSDGNGNPVIGRPVNLAGGGGQSAYLDSAPGNLVGGAIVTNQSQFFGYEFNGLMKILQNDHFRIDGILGFRYLNLHESTELDDQLYPLTSGALTFLGNPVSTSSTMFDFDRFETTNNFYGGQLGTRMEWSWGRWSVDMTTKVALGTSQEKSIISGGTTVYPASGPGTSAAGGILTNTGNIGEYYQSPFAIVPELDLNLAFAITPHLTARIGYTFIYWSSVLRPGDQINSTVSPQLIPSDPSYGTSGPNQPQYQASTTSYWAQGLNLGLDFHF